MAYTFTLILNRKNVIACMYCFVTMDFGMSNVIRSNLYETLYGIASRLILCLLRNALPF